MNINHQALVPSDDQPHDDDQHPAQSNVQGSPAEQDLVDTVYETPVVGQTPRRRMTGLEGLVALAIMVSLAGITAPIVGGKLAEGRLDQTLVDMQHIVDGIRQYSKDTLFLPTGVQGRTDLTWLQGQGPLPQGADQLQGEVRDLADVLTNDSMGGRAWQGPYGQETVDPWGHAYMLQVAGLVDSGHPAWVVSAGPDGVLETSALDRKPVGDDLLLPIN